VVDFVGIFQKLEKALSFDSDEVESVIEHIDVLKDRFGKMMAKDAKPYLALCRGRLDDKGVEHMLDAFAEREPRERFFAFFKELEELYEILSPDVFLRPFIKDYERLVEMRERVLNSFGRHLVGYEQLAEKTASLVREHVTSWGIKETLPLATIDETTLDALKQKGAGKPGKIMNLAKDITDSVRAKQDELPYLIPIGDRVAAVIERYDDRQITTQEALAELEKVVRELAAARREQVKTGLDGGTFTIYLELQREGVADAVAEARELDAAFLHYANFRDSEAALRSLKAALYKVLLKAVGKDRMVEVADRLLRLWKPAAR
jgi:type I restriction enzyme R subunit